LTDVADGFGNKTDNKRDIRRKITKGNTAVKKIRDCLVRLFIAITETPIKVTMLKPIKAKDTPLNILNNQLSWPGVKSTPRSIKKTTMPLCIIRNLSHRG
jgi:hypothetical protein